jgi:hypothetical protein
MSLRTWLVRAAAALGLPDLVREPRLVRPIPDFRGLAIQHWQTLRALERRVSGAWPSERAREAFQLVQAALLYQAHSFPHFGGLLHHGWRLPPSVPRAGAYWNEDDALPFELFLRPNEAIAQMHLASAAVRLPVALQKTIEAYPGSEAPFGDLWGIPRGRREHDWLRLRIEDRFPHVRNLRCCAEGPTLGATEPEQFQRALAIIMVVRDDFGYGEEGDPQGSEYERARKRVLDTIYTCRIVEAQALLIGWATRLMSPPDTVDPRGPKGK